MKRRPLAIPFRRAGAVLATTLLTLAWGTATALAAAGDLDPRFSGDGKQTTDFDGAVDRVADAVLQPDGSIVVAGSSDRSNEPSDSVSEFALARYDSGGRLDDSFGNGGKQTTGFGHVAAPDIGNALDVDAGGRIVVVGGGGGECCSGPNGFALARYHHDGTLDHSFSDDGKETNTFGSQAFDVAIDVQGRIVVVGASYRGFAVARYSQDGTLDESFSGDGMTTTRFDGYAERTAARSVAIQPDGKIVVGGEGYGNRGRGSDFAVARYNENGKLDESFSGDGRRTTDFDERADDIYAVALQSNGKIVAAGRAEDAGAERESTDFALTRYTREGKLDDSFSGDGRRTTDVDGEKSGARDVTLQPDGSIVAAGFVHPDVRYGVDRGRFALARYLPRGKLDDSFSRDGVRTTRFGVEKGLDAADAVSMQPNGAIIAAGVDGLPHDFQPGENQADFAIARFTGE